MTRIVRRVALILGISALVVGIVSYHHATGAKVVIRLSPASAPTSTDTCDPACVRFQHEGAWFRGTVTNVGHRGANMNCTAQAFDSQGGRVYSGYLPMWSFPAGPFLEAGETHTWTGHILATRPLGTLGRLTGSCKAIDYHGNPPV